MISLPIPSLIEENSNPQFIQTNTVLEGKKHLKCWKCSLTAEEICGCRWKWGRKELSVVVTQTCLLHSHTQNIVSTQSKNGRCNDRKHTLPRPVNPPHRGYSHCPLSPLINWTDRQESTQRELVHSAILSACWMTTGVSDWRRESAAKMGADLMCVS